MTSQTDFTLGFTEHFNMLLHCIFCSWFNNKDVSYLLPYNIRLVRKHTEKIFGIIKAFLTIQCNAIMWGRVFYKKRKNKDVRVIGIS